MMRMDGQISFQNTTAKAGDPRSSLGIDIPKNNLPPEYLLKEGVEYWREGVTADQEVEEARKLLKEILASK